MASPKNAAAAIDLAGRLAGYAPPSNLTDGIVLLSPFDGAGGARVAVEGMGIPVRRHMSAELDPHAQRVLQERFPDVEQYGDIRNLNNPDESVDLMCAGFPCQELSRANPTGKGLQGDRSGPGLVEALRVRDQYQPRYWMFENVVPRRDEDLRSISRMIGTDPVIYDAADFGPMTRKRAFWTNVPQKPHVPSDALFRNALLESVPERYMMTPVQREYMFRTHADGRTPWDRWGNHIEDPKVRTLTAGLSRGSPFNHVMLDDGSMRRLTPEEVERLFGFPEGHTSGVSDTQRYRMMGNSWSVPTVQQVLRGLAE